MYGQYGETVAFDKKKDPKGPQRKNCVQIRHMEDVNTPTDYEAELAAQVLDQKEALQSIQDAIEAEPSEELMEVGKSMHEGFSHGDI